MAMSSKSRGSTPVKQLRILVVDDEERICIVLGTKLKAAGHEALIANDGKQAIEMIRDAKPDIVILDLLLPGMSGFDVLKELRRISRVPVIILSVKGADDDKIRGLQLGADDYLPKPFNPDELLARIEAVMRRSMYAKKRKVPRQFVSGDLVIDFDTHTVLKDHQEIYLTRIEWRLLTEFVTNAGRPILYKDILTRVWGPDRSNELHLLRVWVNRLRKKIEKGPTRQKLIYTLPCTGYVLKKPANTN
jgi:DNA-binding response OmpR family regulator